MTALDMQDTPLERTVRAERPRLVPGITEARETHVYAKSHHQLGETDGFAPEVKVNGTYQGPAKLGQPYREADTDLGGPFGPQVGIGLGYSAGRR
jgi:hypothetical protein